VTLLQKTNDSSRVKLNRIYERKINKEYLNPEKIQDVVEFRKTKHSELYEEEKKAIEEVKTANSVSSKTGVQFEFNMCYLFNVQKFKMSSIYTYFTKI
jgi:predicted RNA methylase